MDSMAGCQYRMTSYEERVNSSDMDPSYGIHMHDPRVIEYMGAPSDGADTRVLAGAHGS